MPSFSVCVHKQVGVGEDYEADEQDSSKALYLIFYVYLFILFMKGRFTNSIPLRAPKALIHCVYLHIQICVFAYAHPCVFSVCFYGFPFPMLTFRCIWSSIWGNALLHSCF